jgi:hypothetical protein
MSRGAFRAFYGRLDNTGNGIAPAAQLSTYCMVSVVAYQSMVENTSSWILLQIEGQVDRFISPQLLGSCDFLCVLIVILRMTAGIVISKPSFFA